jgi:hypothetical protein
MSERHQIIIDCGLAGDSTCQLNEAASQRIDLKVQQFPAQYNYYLLFNNHFNQDCQLCLQAQANKKINTNSLSDSLVRIYFQEQILFEGNFVDFLAKKIDLLNLNAWGSRLYRFEFYLTKNQEDFQINFDLDFHLSCSEEELKQLEKKAVLGSQTEFREILPDQIIEKDNAVIRQQRAFLIFALLFFILLLVLIFLLFRKKFKKVKKY